MLQGMRSVVLIALGLSPSLVGAAAVRAVPICSGITLSASYLVDGPSFRFTLTNNTARAIRLAEPIPSSSDWYALSHGRWLWRASNGSGGSLVDAGNQHGRVRVYPPPPGEVSLVTLPPHQSKQWTVRQEENPVLAYNPGCKLCSYPGESEYQVVFAYAYDAGKGQGLLPCGLRTAPVPMPPKK
jgi:hypothetical protein